MVRELTFMATFIQIDRATELNDTAPIVFARTARFAPRLCLARTLSGTFGSEKVAIIGARDFRRKCWEATFLHLE